jgi:hypothetical protein
LMNPTVGPLTAWVGRAGAATRRDLGDSKGQQGTTNPEVSGRFAAIHLVRETPGLGFHTAEAMADSFRSCVTRIRCPKPKPGPGRLHGLVHHGQQLARERVEVDLLA